MPRSTALQAIIAALTLMLTSAMANAGRSLEVRGAERGSNAEGVLTISELGRSGSSSAICSVTLLRTLSRILPKITGTRMGAVTGVAIDIASCGGGEFAAPSEFAVLRSDETRSCRELGSRRQLCVVDWAVTYEGFLGTLPEITGVLRRVAGTRFQLVSISRRAITGVRALPEKSIFRGGGFLCPYETLTIEGIIRDRPALTIALL
jgi:hypothetical protein